MTDKKHHDDEYQFPNDEFIEGMDVEPEVEPTQESEIEPETVELEESSSLMSGFLEIWESHKRMIIIIGVVTAVTLVFAVMRSMHKTESVQTPITQPATVSEPVISQTDPEVVEQLTGLKQDTINNNVAIRQLQSQVRQLNASLTQSRASQQQLNQSMRVLLDEVQKLTGQVQTLSQPKQETKAVSVKKEPAAPVITFKLRAVVPGRAWIVGSNGESYSVSVGSQIPQYGNVQSIDADEGIIITTSGKTIRFEE